jgi:hypothetical protein
MGAAAEVTERVRWKKRGHDQGDNREKRLLKLVGAETMLNS